jgi:ankyrin repeat protein
MITLLSRKFVVSVILTMAIAIALPSCTRYSHSLDASLREAACGGDVTTIRKLLMLGANVNATDVPGYSALMVLGACTAHPGRGELVELLIANGAVVNLQARDGSNALMYAAGNGDTQAVKALLKGGASVNIADNEGQTALMKAVRFSCNEDTIRALVDAGADLTATDHKGQSALSSTCLNGTRLGELLHPTRGDSDR